MAICASQLVRYLTGPLWAPLGDEDAAAVTAEVLLDEVRSRPDTVVGPSHVSRVETTNADGSPGASYYGEVFALEGITGCLEQAEAAAWLGMISRAELIERAYIVRYLED